MQRAMPQPAPPTLLDVAAHAPGAAALIAGALGEEDRKALRLAHPALRDAVAVELVARSDMEGVLRRYGRRLAPGSICPRARPPTARRWPALELLGPARGFERLRALRDEPWPRLEELSLGSLRLAGRPQADVRMFALTAARFLALAAPRLPSVTFLSFEEGISEEELASALSVEWRALEALAVLKFEGPAADAAADAPPARELAAQPRLRSVTLLAASGSSGNSDAAAGVRWLVARGWPLDWLNVDVPDAASLAALVAAPALAALEFLELQIVMDSADLRALAATPWPLKNLRICSVACAWLFEDRLALAALAAPARLRRLEVLMHGLSTAAFRALAAAAWPEVLHFCVVVEEDEQESDWADSDNEDEGDALDAASFALCPKLEELYLRAVPMGAASARVLASRRWARLEVPSLTDTQLDDTALAALARGAWPALVHLNLWHNAGIRAPPTLADVRRWAPARTHLSLGLGVPSWLLPTDRWRPSDGGAAVLAGEMSDAELARHRV
jgi:hypothetical protein